jgi:hypothetical protein
MWIDGMVAGLVFVVRGVGRSVGGSDTVDDYLRYQRRLRCRGRRGSLEDGLRPVEGDPGERRKVGARGVNLGTAAWACVSQVALPRYLWCYVIFSIVGESE